MSIKVNFAVNDGLQLNGNTLSVGNTTTNVMSNSTTIFVGNSTVNLSINSTSFSGTSNNTLYLGGTAAAGYQTTAGLSGNVATLTSNNALYLGGTAAAGYQTTAGLAGNVATLTANNALYLGGVVSTAYVNTSGAYTISGIHTHNANIIFGTSTTLQANGTAGTPGQFLTSNGTQVYWSSPSPGVNSSAQYTFSNTITFTGTINAVAGIYANNSFGAPGQYLLSNGTSSYWSTPPSLGGTTNIQNLTQNLNNTAPVAVDTVSGSVATTVEYLVSARDHVNSNFKSSRIIITTDGTSSFMNEYGIVQNVDGIQVCDFTASYTGGNIVLTANAASANVDIALQRVNLGVGTANGNIAGTFTAVNTANQYTFSNTILFSSQVNVVAVSANGGIGGAGAILTSNGTGTYWGTVAGVNTTAQYTYSNIMVFNANLVLNNTGSVAAPTGGQSGAGFFFNDTTNTFYTSNTIYVGNSTVSSFINGTSFSGTSNNALYLGGTLASGYQTTAGLSGNVATLTSNNALYLGGTAAAGYQTTAGLSGNVATLTSNNALYLGGTLASGYQLNSTLNANIASYLPTYAGIVNASSFTVGTFVSVNATNISIGNSTVNTTANSTHFFSGNSTVYGFTNSTAEAFVNGTGNNISTPTSWVLSNSTATYTTANLSGIYTAGTINAASFSIGATVTVNSTIANVTALNVVGAATIGGNLTVTGNLTLSGTTTFVNSTVITTNDLNFILANNATTNTLANNAGLVIGSSANLIYNASVPAWQSNVGFIPSVNNLSLGTTTALWNINANQISGTLTTVSQPNITANNSNYLGGTAAAGYQTTAGLAGNVATLTANNTLYLGGTSAASFVVGNSNIYANTIIIGNSTINSTANSTTAFTQSWTVNVTSNSTTTIDSWDTTKFLSAQYFISVYDRGANNFLSENINLLSTGVLGTVYMNEYGIMTSTANGSPFILFDSLNNSFGAGGMVLQGTYLSTYSNTIIYFITRTLTPIPAALAGYGAL